MKKILTLLFLVGSLSASQDWFYSNSHTNDMKDEPKVIVELKAEEKAKEIAGVIKNSYVSYWSNAENVLYVPKLKEIKVYKSKEYFSLFNMGYSIEINEYQYGALFFKINSEKHLAIGLRYSPLKTIFILLASVLFIVVAIRFLPSVKTKPQAQ